MRAPRTFYLVRQVHNQVRVLLERGLAAFDITPAQYTLMNWLSLREAMTSAMLARAQQVSPQTMNTLISGLHKRGLVTRKKDSKNKRILLISLTERGRETMSACERAVDRLENEFLAPLGATDLVALRYILETLMTPARRAKSAA